MSDCAAIEDIVYSIISTLSIRRDRKAIAALARTCSVFHEPAMNALWRRLDGLGPLLECMPSDLVTERFVPAAWAEPYLDVQACFTRQPTATEWDQMFKHAHRVKELTLGMGLPRGKRCRSASSYSAEVLSSVAQHMQERTHDSDEPLFPNLLVLRCQWYNKLQGMLECIPRFAGPSLQTVKIYGSVTQSATDTEPLPNFINAVITAYPKINNLIVVADCDPGKQSASCSSVVSDFVRNTLCLRQFQSNITLSVDAASHLISMPFLSALTIQLPDNFPQADSSVSLGSLGSVDVTARHLDTCTNFIASLRTNSLKTLVMQVQESCEESDVIRCFDILRTHKSLRHIRAFADRTRFTPVNACVISGSTLSLLYPLSDLEVLVLEEHIGVDLYDQDTVAISKAWPRLRNLTLVAIPEAIRFHSRAHLTLTGLLNLAKGCPSLHRLGISIDASNVDARFLDQAINCGSAGENLFMLEVHAPISPVAHPEKVAVFLHTVFPGLRVLSFGENEACMSEGWSSVWRIVRSLLFRHVIL